MSDTTSSPDARGPRAETLIIAAICVLVLIAGWYVLSQRQQTLRASPAGLDGLQVWLSSKKVSTQNFSGGWLMDQNSIGLLVLPVYDTALDKDRTLPKTKEELLQQQDEFDLKTSVIFEKAQKVPTLVVLPKWRSGMRLTGRAHPVLISEADGSASPLNKLMKDNDTELVFAEKPFSEFSYRSSEGMDLRAEIYSARMFKSKDCIPIIGKEDAMILADCPLRSSGDTSGARVYVLSDPDLLNNHGLRLGDNAKIALDFLGSKADDRNIVIDYSRSVWLRDPSSEPERERTWADLLRFFEQPFLTLWIRYGPIRSDGAAPGASKSLAVRARARLMRLSGQDGALAREYAAARIAATAEALFGVAHARHYASEDEFLKYADRRHPAQAPLLRGILSEIRTLPAHLPASEAIHQIDKLEQVLEHITHDA
jgi:hypothetical protein